jgi:hypothetical protein
LTDKTFHDHVSDWFRILLRSGVPALFVGLGWILLVFAVALGSSWNSNAGFWVATVFGAMMIALGFVLYRRGPRPRAE